MEKTTALPSGLQISEHASSFSVYGTKMPVDPPLGEGKTSGELRRKRRRYFPFSGNISAHFYHIVPQRRERPLCSGPLPCNSPASRHERGVSPFPFAAYLLREIALQWLTFVHTAYKKPLWCILAPTVPFAWGFSPRSFKAGT